MNGASDTEFVLCNMSFPKDIKVLFDPNVWICDTAATCHCTPHDEGMVNAKTANSETTTMGNGSKVTATSDNV